MKKESKIFVIVVTYKGMRWYDKCFGSLRESTIPLQTVVVDNTPGDEDADYIREHYPEVHLIKPETNLGFGQSNNVGMRYALDNGCDYVFLLNQDAWIDTDTLAIMVPIAEKHTECGLFSPIHIAADTNTVNFIVEDDSRDHANALMSDCYFQTFKDVYYCRYVNAAAWLLPRKTLDTVGGFDPMFFMYGEDDQYLQRLKYFRLWAGIIPKTKITHDHPKEASTHIQALPETIKLNERLTKYLNISTPMSVSRWILHNAKRLMKAIVKFDGVKIRYYYEEIVFLIQNRKSISQSRQSNIKVGQTWL